ncbi:MAG: class E sortase [Corynebacterium sp.]|nr:class E sortase [Corynebacterium sp.]
MKAHPFSILQFLGELLLTLGVIFLLFAVYEAWWTNIEASQNQAQAASQLDEEWVNPRQKVAPELGDAFARLYIPAFGSDYEFAIVEGTSDADLLKGPGHYTDTALPGEKGNFAVAGHRVGKGAPFNDLDNLNVCDTIVVETSASWNIYKVLPMGPDRSTEVGCLNPEQQQRVIDGDYAHVLGRHITDPGDYPVVHALPETDLVEANDTLEPVLTLTTCHPQFSAKERMIIHAMLVRQEPKTAGSLPAELA